MKSLMPKLVVITPIEHIEGLAEKLRSKFDVVTHPDPVLEDAAEDLKDADAVFTNPNKSRLAIRGRFFGAAPNLKVVTTASTGLLHIDLEEAGRRGIKVISLTKEFETIEKISSTAEHALALTLSALRRVPWSFRDVLDGGWDYEKFIGRQMNALTVGVVGYGRLGRKYARYVQAMGAETLVCDPAYTKDTCPFPLVSLEEIMRRCDIVALHVHATPENIGMINSGLLSLARPDLLLVNTARGEIVDENALADFLGKNPKALAAVDVLADEIEGKWNSPLVNLAREGKNVLITPHIGGMTKEAQEIAYHRVADMLIEAFADIPV